MQFPDFDKPNVMRVNFFYDGSRHMAEITSVTDDKATNIKKVTPEVIAQFPKDWEAYEKGLEAIDVGGTPLDEVPGLDRNSIMGLRLKGIRNAEELASLTDTMLQQMGLGFLAWGRAARNLVKLKELEAMQAVMEEAKAKRGPGRPRKDDAAVTVDAAD